LKINFIIISGNEGLGQGIRFVRSDTEEVIKDIASSIIFW